MYNKFGVIIDVRFKNRNGIFNNNVALIGFAGVISVNSTAFVNSSKKTI